ncbi:MAG: tnp [Nitrospirae bacterium]|nr:tnp [Nitrospirota bacterium]
MYVGIDYHKRYAVATSMDDRGQVIETVRLKNEPGDLIGFVDRLLEDSKIAIEATCNWYYFYELLEGKSPEIHLAHPLKTRAIAEARIKTDKIDSTIPNGP